MKSYRLEKVKINRGWDNFVKNSPNGSLFSFSNYLKNVNAKTAAYYCLDKQEVKAAVILIETEDGRSTCLHDFVVYNGIMFCEPSKNQNHSQILSDQFKVLTFISDELINMYESIELSLHPSLIDIRPFLWTNYGSTLPKFGVDVRYTSYVDISDFAGSEKLEGISIYNKASYSRRQEVRYAIKDGVETKRLLDADKFIEFYLKTMNRQDIDVSRNVQEEMRRLIVGLFKEKMGKMFVSFTSSGQIGSMAFFGVDNKRAYYLFGANDPDLRDKHTGTAVLWDAFRSLSKEGCSEVDLEGVNSPKRGWFKLSFGGDLRAYYQIIKKLN